MLTGMERIKQLVEMAPERKLQTLIHLVNETTLKEVHAEQERKKAPGIDKITKAEYEKNLEANVQDLIGRMKTFSYRPQPVRRTYIEKEGSAKLRPLGIPAYEDRLVQGVISEILQIIYEPKFYDFSYGFRPGRDCHQAVKHLDDKLMGKTSWVVDADIKGFFDNVDHDWMMKFLEHEIADKNLLRYIKRFLKAGILESGEYMETDSGVPQGGLCSPIMANVYLHYVVDVWFDKRVAKQSRGECSMVRYADDIVFCFQYQDDAENFYQQLKTRLAKFGLELSEDKSKIVKFGRFAGKEAGKFDFVGFTFMCSQSRNGKFLVKCRTSEKKLKVKRAKASKWIRENMHTPIKELISKLNQKLRGHYNYYGLSHNMAQMRGFYKHVTYVLFKTLKRRSQKDKMNWGKFNKILEYFPLLKPKITVPLW
jgi:group II intron reverse transcriptase/maturase